MPDEPDIELPSYVRALADELHAGGTWLTPTLTPLRAIARRAEMRASPDPRLAYVTREVRRELDPAADPRYQAWTSIEWDFIKRACRRRH